MSILDDAIREHLELKRAHGAAEGEVQRLEDEAFGAPQRPDEIDPFAEPPTEFLATPDEAPASAPELGDEAERSGRRPDITDLQEAPPPAAGTGAFDSPPAAPEELAPAPDAPPPSPADAAAAPPPPPADAASADLAPPTAATPPPADATPPPVDAPPSPEASPAAEASLPNEGEIELPAEGPSTEERHAIADQPTQMFDVQAELVDEPAAEGPVDAAGDAPPAPTSSPPPEQESLATRGPDAEVAGHPPTEEESAEFDFFNEQRLSDELDQALEAPLTGQPSLPGYEDAPAGEGGVFDFEATHEPYEDDPSEEVLRRADAAEQAEQPSEEEPLPGFESPTVEASRPDSEPPSEEAPRAAAESPAAEDERDYDPETGHDDVLEDTPRFLEDQPEDDDLWFEQKPPKDFDLD